MQSFFDKPFEEQVEEIIKTGDLKLLQGNVQKSVSNGIFSSTQFSIYLERKYQVET